MKSEFILSKQDIDNLTEEETTVSEDKTYIKFEIPEWVKWVARDKNGALYGFREPPIKYNAVWSIVGVSEDVSNMTFITQDPNHYPQVKWSDEEPTTFKDGVTVTSEPSDFVDPVTADGMWRTPTGTKVNEYYTENEDGTISYTRVEVPEPDMIQNPPHYKQYSFEPIDIITEVVKEYPPEIGFHVGTVLKYLFRSPFKGKQEEDLEKSAYYLARAIKELTDE